VVERKKEKLWLDGENENGKWNNTRILGEDKQKQRNYDRRKNHYMQNNELLILLNGVTTLFSSPTTLKISTFCSDSGFMYRICLSE
jgi:hypothetical protein